MENTITYRCVSCGRYEDLPATHTDDELDEIVGDHDCGNASLHEVRPGQKTLMYVNAYEVYRAYGGPEEGGWWYDRGEAKASVPVRGEYRNDVYRGVRPSPVSQDVVEVTELLKRVYDDPELRIVTEETPAADYPTRRPRYE